MLSLEQWVDSMKSGKMLHAYCDGALISFPPGSIYLKLSGNINEGWKIIATGAGGNIDIDNISVNKREVLLKCMSNYEKMLREECDHEKCTCDPGSACSV